jgi:hypothetical protein
MRCFSMLSRFLSQKMAKIEYIEAMEQIIGKENIPLHNHLITSILQNAMRPQDVPGPSGHQ